MVNCKPYSKIQKSHLHVNVLLNLSRSTSAIHTALHCEVFLPIICCFILQSFTLGIDNVFLVLSCEWKEIDK